MLRIFVPQLSFLSCFTSPLPSHSPSFSLYHIHPFLEAASLRYFLILPVILPLSFAFSPSLWCFITPSPPHPSFHSSSLLCLYILPYVLNLPFISYPSFHASSLLYLIILPLILNLCLTVSSSFVSRLISFLPSRPSFISPLPPHPSFRA
jgi:hypothetical protein